MRERDKALVETTREAIATGGFPLSLEQKVAIASTCYPRREDAARIEKWIDKKLTQPDIRAAMVDIFGSVGITPLYLLEKTKEHIEGVEYDKVLRTKEGEEYVERVKDKPSYAALRDATKMLFPVAATKVQIDQRVLTGTIEPPVRNGPPPTGARLLGSARVQVETIEDDDAAD